MIRIHAGFNKKVPGEQEYSSDGVHVALEMELPDAYLGDRRALQERIQGLIEEARSQAEAQLDQGRHPRQEAPRDALSGPRSREEPTNGHRASKDRPATSKQLSYLLGLAKRAKNLSPEDLCRHLQIQSLQEITARQASDLIERLKEAEVA